MVLQDNNLNKRIIFEDKCSRRAHILVISAYSFSLVYVMTKESTKLFSEFNYLIFVLDMVGKLSDKLEWMKTYHYSRCFVRKKLLKDHIIYGR